MASEPYKSGYLLCLEERNQFEAELTAANARAEAAERQVAALAAERDELLRHQNTSECTRYGHRWGDAFGPNGALCRCGAMVFAVWADEVRPSTEWEREHPADVRVITNPERSARAQAVDDERELAASGGAAPAVQVGGSD